MGRPRDVPGKLCAPDRGLLVVEVKAEQPGGDAVGARGERAAAGEGGGAEGALGARDGDAGDVAGAGGEAGQRVLALRG